MVNRERIKNIADMMVEHGIRMNIFYGRDFVSRHEAISVIREEFEEAWDAVKLNKSNAELISELNQVGAMTMLMAECLYEDKFGN